VGQGWCRGCSKSVERNGNL